MNTNDLRTILWAKGDNSSVYSPQITQTEFEVQTHKACGTRITVSYPFIISHV